MLQVFYMVVAKVDQDVVMAIYVCCKCLFQMFHLFFSNVHCISIYFDDAYVSHICWKYFIWILHIFSNGFSSIFSVFLQVFQTHVSTVSSAFRCMLQMFHLDFLKSRSGVAHVTIAPLDSE
jgi:hypothetical protein